MTRSMPPSSGAMTGATMVTDRWALAAVTVLANAVAAARERRHDAERADVEVLEHAGELLGAILGIAAQARHHDDAVRLAQQRHRVGDVDHRRYIEHDEVVAVAGMFEQLAHLRRVEQVVSPAGEQWVEAHL